jgi:outer membrane protein assembly factor BamB
LKSVTFTILATAALGIAQDAAMFRGNPTHTGVYQASGVPELKSLKWKFQTGGKVISSPVLSGDTVFVGSYDENLYAVDAASGKLKWKFKTEGPVLSSPAVAYGLVYFGSYDGQFYALDVRTGQAKWKFATEGERRFEAVGGNSQWPPQQTIPDLWDCYLSSPAVVDGKVYFGSGDGKLYALDAETGAIKWRFVTHGVVHASPAVADGTVYFGSWDTFFYAVDAATGQEKWRFKTNEDSQFHNQTGIQSSAAVADGLVYFGCRDSHLYALDVKTGKQVWSYPTRGTWIVTSPAVRDGTVYFETSDTSLFRAVDAKTGKDKFSLQAAQLFLFSSPALAGDIAYFGSFDGRFYAVDLKNAKFAWQFQTEASKQQLAKFLGPDGKISYNRIFTSRQWEVAALDIERLHSLGSILSSPAVADGAVYFGSTDGNLYALE